MRHMEQASAISVSRHFIRQRKNLPRWSVTVRQQTQEVSTDTSEASDGDFISDTALLTGTAGTKADTKEDTTGVDISFEDDINIGQDDTEDILSDGTTVESATVEMTDSLKQILKKGTTVSSKNDAVIYPQQPDNSDIQIEFED